MRHDVMHLAGNAVALYRAGHLRTFNQQLLVVALFAVIGAQQEEKSHDRPRDDNDEAESRQRADAVGIFQTKVDAIHESPPIKVRCSGRQGA